MSAPFTLKWGILATGGIAKAFSKDLLVNPLTRNVSDVKHEIVAVGSSSSVEKVKQFIKEIDGSDSIKAYGSYDELVADSNIDIIYVATPHPYHHQNAKQALLAGKHVLCEKPFTMTAEQAQDLINIARQKKLFLMEAVWTRYFPLTLELQKLLFKDRIIGKIRRVFSDLSIPFGIDNLPKTHRIIDPKLGGGAMLDIGPYALTWVFLTAFADPDNKRKAPITTSNMLKTEETEVDESTMISMVFPESRVTAVATCHLRVSSPSETACIIQGDKGDITVHFPAYRPEAFTVQLFPEGPDKNGDTKKPEPVTHDFKMSGHGQFYEADECARCLRDGKLESDIMPLDESLIIMEVMDKVRTDNGLEYPESVLKL